MSNLLFLVELPENMVPCDAEPTSALLRIHCNIDFRRLLDESIVFTMLSERFKLSKKTEVMIFIICGEMESGGY